LSQGSGILFVTNPSPKSLKGMGPGLYNLKGDPTESRSLAVNHPDVVKRLQQEGEVRVVEINQHKRPVGKGKADQ